MKKNTVYLTKKRLILPLFIIAIIAFVIVTTASYIAKKSSPYHKDITDSGERSTIVNQYTCEESYDLKPYESEQTKIADYSLDGTLKIVKNDEHIYGIQVKDLNKWSGLGDSDKASMIQNIYSSLFGIDHTNTIEFVKCTGDFDDNNGGVEWIGAIYYPSSGDKPVIRFDWK